MNDGTTPFPQPAYTYRHYVAHLTNHHNTLVIHVRSAKIHARDYETRYLKYREIVDIG